MALPRRHLLRLPHERRRSPSIDWLPPPVAEVTRSAKWCPTPGSSFDQTTPPPPQTQLPPPPPHSNPSLHPDAIHTHDLASPLTHLVTSPPPQPLFTLKPKRLHRRRRCARAAGSARTKMRTRRMGTGPGHHASSTETSTIRCSCRTKIQRLPRPAAPATTLCKTTTTTTTTMRSVTHRLERRGDTDDASRRRSTGDLLPRRPDP